MRNALLIAARELRGYVNAPIAWVWSAAFLAFVNWYFFRGFFLFGEADLRPFFLVLPWVFLFLVPAVTMRLWSEERKQGTLEVLLTFPVGDAEAVTGKFMAAWIFLALTLGLTLPIPLTVSLLGDLDPGPVLGGYLGALLMGAAYLAIGLLCSSVTENQIVAFILAVAASFALFVVGEDFVLVAAPPSLAPLLSYLGLGTHYRSLLRGVVDTRDLVYYLSMTGFFLFANVRALEGRKL